MSSDQFFTRLSNWSSMEWIKNYGKALILGGADRLLSGLANPHKKEVEATNQSDIFSCESLGPNKINLIGPDKMRVYYAYMDAREII